jgi:hypothetical protein
MSNSNSSSYEAFVIYTFVALLVELLEGEEGTINILKSKENIHLPFPLGRVKLPPPDVW